VITLSNGIVSLTLDDQARLVSFENVKSGKGNIISRPRPIFRCVLQNGENWEDMAYAENAEMTMAVSGDTATIQASALNTRMGKQDIQLALTIRLEGEKALFGAVIDNHSNATVNDFYFPCIGAIKTLGEGKPGLLYPDLYGEYHTDICNELADLQTWDGQQELTRPYPYSLSMQWMSLIDQKQCLYMAAHDSLFHATSLRAIGSEDRDVTLEIDKMAFVAPGEKWAAPEYVVWLYEGAWQDGADEYAAWAKTWRHPVTPKKWMQEMNGYFLVINKQQFGDEIWPYEEIPHLYDQALEHGCDTVGLFGWYQTGHDNYYPDLEVSHTMGGEELLRKGIKNIQERGGHVTLYHQGHLMDVGSPFYKEIGHKLEGKSRWGTPYFEQYNKYSESDYLRQYTKKTFSTVCPWCKEWHELMQEKTHWIHGFGADGVLFDQIGGISPTPCFDQSHGHTKPSLSYAQGRLKLLPAIRQAADEHENFAFMTETNTDVYSQFIDCIHGIGSRTGAKGERASFQEKKRPMVFNCPEMFRHCFPETISTLRNSRPYLHPRMADYALCYGFRFELELRYLKDKRFVDANQHPEWKEHAQAVCALRKKHMNLLLKGAYSCDRELAKLNPVLHHGVFTNGNEKCLVLWNDTDEAISLNLGSHKVDRWETAENAGEGAPDTVPANTAIVLF